MNVSMSYLTITFDWNHHGIFHHIKIIAGSAFIPCFMCKYDTKYYLRGNQALKLIGLCEDCFDFHCFLRVMGYGARL